MRYLKKSRRESEIETVETMIRMYCKAKHKTENLCRSCDNLVTYTNIKQEHCVFGESKPVCSQCQVHCYQTKEREEIKEIMRFAGPRMIFYHPVMAIDHFRLKNKHINS